MDIMETLDEWYQYEIQNLSRFYGYYKDKINSEPEIFPNKLSEGEFDEQYRIWSE